MSTETPSLTDLEVEREAEAYERCLEMLAGLRATRRADVLVRLGAYFGETPSLTTEQARGFSARFAAWHAFDQARKDDPGHVVPACRWLEDSERDQLFAWVRAWMDTTPGGRADKTLVLQHTLGLDYTQAKTLRDSSGWPS